MRSTLLAQLPAPAGSLIERLDRPLSRRLILLAAVLGGMAIVVLAVFADTLGLRSAPPPTVINPALHDAPPASNELGGLQSFGIITGLCIVLVAATLGAVDFGPRLRGVALALGALTLAAGVWLIGLLLFTGFFGLHESGRGRVIQFAYLEAATLAVLGGRVFWSSGLGQWPPTRWLLARTGAAWLVFDSRVAALGPPFVRAGAATAGRMAWGIPLVRLAGRLPALDLALALVLATWAAMSRLSLSEGARAVFVPAAYLLVPFLVGYLAVRLLERVRGTEMWAWSFSSLFIVCWFLGAVALTALTMTFQHAGFRWGLQHLDVVYFALASAGWLAVNVPDHRESLRVNLAGVVSPLRYHWPLLLAVTFSLAPRLLTGYYNPFPEIERNFSDPRISSQDTLRMIQDGYLTLTNVSHPPAVVSVTGTLATLLRVQPLSIMWVVSIAQFAVFAAGIYALTWRLTHNRLGALLAALFGLFIFSGSVGFEGTPLRLRSNTLIYSFFPLALAAVHEVATRAPAREGRGIWGIGGPLIFLGVGQVVFFLVMNIQVFTPIEIEWRGMLLLAVAGLAFATWPWWRRASFAWPGAPMLLLLIAGWQLFHVYEAPIFVASMLVFGLMLSLMRDGRRRWLALAITGAIAAVFAGLLLSEVLPSVTASKLIFGSTYDSKTGGIGQKLRLMDQATAGSAFVFFLLGIVVAAIRRSRLLLVSLGMAAFGYAVYFFPDAHTVRSYKIITPFMALLSAAACVWLYEHLRRRTRSPWLAPALGVVGIVALGYLVSRPLHDHFRSIPLGQSYFSALNDVEYDAIHWFEENTGYEVRIISDYQTMQLFNTVGNIPSIVERKYWPVEMSSVGQQQVKVIKNFIFNALSPEDAHQAALSLLGTEPNEEKRYLEIAGKTVERPRLFIVVSGKTSVWRFRASDDPIFTPINEKPLEGDVNRFDDSRYFRLAYEIPDPADPGGVGFLYVWEVVQ